MDRTELILGRGEVYFDRFATGTQTGQGERYIGNTNSFQIERRLETVDRRTTRRGVRMKNMREVTAQDFIITFTTDNITAENLSDWLGGTESVKSVTRLGAQSETFELVPGRFYQLGLPTYPGIGARNLFGLCIRVGNNFLTSGLYVDEVNGRFGVPISRTDLTGQMATVEYEVRNSSGMRIEVERKSIRGALRFIGRNPVGRQDNYFIPHVLLTPRDQIQLKGDGWMSLTYEAEVLADMVIYESGKAGRSPGELALIEQGINPSDFVVIEGVLQQAVNG